MSIKIYNLKIDEIKRLASATAIRIQNKLENSPGVEAGTHTFNFSFPLPSTGLYTSFDAKNSAGCIRYYLLLKVLNGSCLVLRKKLLFPIVCPTVLINYPMPKSEQVIAQRKDVEKLVL